MTTDVRRPVPTWQRRLVATLVVAAAVALAAAVSVRAQFGTPNRTFHNATGFPLDGKHLTVACESCHLGASYKGTPTTCYECHWVRRKDDKFQTRLGSQCEQCHRPTSWSAVRWDHAATTGVSLNGAHATIGCESCHVGAEFRTASLGCVSCHQKEYQATTAPNHAAAGFPTTCDACHRVSDTTWTGSAGAFNHASVYPLVGPHATQTCVTCHKGGIFKGTPRDCVGCHKPEYDRSQNPNHAAAGFPTTCDQCHKPSDATWKGASAGTSFNHATIFPLVGLHATAACTACHRNNVYRGTSRDCVGCHRNEYDRAQTPNHVQAGFPTTCDQCHRPTDTAWRGGSAAGSFNHNAVFPLQGLHATQPCQACHRNGIYKGTPRDCVGCHRSDYDRSQNPNHVQAGFPTTCEQCHKATDPAWRGAGAGSSFNHASVFPLVGVHATQACAACHRNGIYKGTPRDCVGCHKPDYDRTQNPNHAQAGLPTTCDQCHRPTDPTWQTSAGGFNHASVFPLVGVHATQACLTCHRNGIYKGTPRDCVGCHKPDYDRTQNPNHAQAGFSTSCDTCHKPTDPTWRNGTSGFNHASVFALVGVHATQACTACHKNGVYKGTPRDCVGCHKPDYDRAANPNHVQSGFSTTCDQCHKPTDPTWKGASFNHGQFFALVGVHATQACTACHKNGVYKGTPRDCVGCHRAKYDATRNPNHTAAGFPTTCDQCHKATDTAWTQGKFNHTQFPLSGPHNVTCAQCHTTPNNFQAFSCTVCHDRTRTDAQHRGRSGYRYDSLACYQCHPTGRGG
ncbi:MAG: hypothetical protein U0Q12_28175 [Vicinamibacterales bacterium]